MVYTRIIDCFYLFIKLNLLLNHTYIIGNSNYEHQFKIVSNFNYLEMFYEVIIYGHTIDDIFILIITIVWESFVCPNSWDNFYPQIILLLQNRRKKESTKIF